MTENMKKFLSRISEDQEAAERFSRAEKDALIAEAKDMGIELTDADFAPEENAMSDDELEAVAGGKHCTCVIGGGGKGGTYDAPCACAAYGGGNGMEMTYIDHYDLSNNPVGPRVRIIRCGCPVVGTGGSCE